MEVSGRKPFQKRRVGSVASLDSGAQARATEQPSQSGKVQNICDPCDLRGHRNSPDGYCLDCGEYLCSECYKVHLYPQPCRDHDLLDACRMPRQKIPPVEACMTHRDEKLKFYCKDHAIAVCNLCIMLQHRRCKNVCSVSEMSSNVNVEQRCEDLRKKISALQKRTDIHRQLVTKNIAKLETTKIEIKADIKAFCKRMHQKLYDLEKNVDADVDKIGEEDRHTMDRILDECDTLNGDLGIVSVMLKNNHSFGKKDKLFITVEKADDTLQRVEDKLKTLNDDNVVKKYTFEPDDRLNSLIEDVEELGHLIKQTWYIDSVTGQKNDGINVRSTADTKTCWISGSVTLQKDTILSIADNQNKSVKLVDVIQKKVLSDIRLSSGPWDITKVKCDQLAVTLPDESKIQFLQVNGTLISLGNSFKTLRSCRGITFTGDQLIVTFTTADKEKVQILSMTGEVFKTFVNGRDGQPRFHAPYYVCVCPDRSLTYVSDFVANSLVCMTTDGQVKGKYTHEELDSPEQIAVADDGFVFLACRGSNTVHIISTYCEHGRIVVDRNHRLDEPFSLSYSRSQESLYIGQYNSDMLQVFKLV